jgi:hypothetical protein
MSKPPRCELSYQGAYIKILRYASLDVGAVSCGRADCSSRSGPSHQAVSVPSPPRDGPRTASGWHLPSPMGRPSGNLSTPQVVCSRTRRDDLPERPVLRRACQPPYGAGDDRTHPRTWACCQAQTHLEGRSDPSKGLRRGRSGIRSVIRAPHGPTARGALSTAQPCPHRRESSTARGPLKTPEQARRHMGRFSSTHAKFRGGPN